MEDVMNKEKPQPPVKMDLYSEELFKKIKEENITLDPAVWSLLTHVLGNRTYAISLILGDFLDTPKWIIKAGSYVMMFLYKITGGKGGMYSLDVHLQKALNNTIMIKEFLSRLRGITKKKDGF